MTVGSSVFASTAANLRSKDLTFCYLHMTSQDLATLDFFDEFSAMGELGKDSKQNCHYSFMSSNHVLLKDIEVPDHLIPPDPDDGDSE